MAPISPSFPADLCQGHRLGFRDSPHMLAMKVIYYVAASLDGFIADRDEGVEWLDQVSIDQESTGYEAFFGSVDGLLMGRKTFDFVYDYGKWPYEDLPTWVCSRRDVPHIEGCNLQCERTPDASISKAKSVGISTLWLVGGGRLATDLIRDRQVTHLRVSVMPILLGNGVPIVQTLPNHIHLRQEKSTTRSGFTEIEYRVDR